MGKLYIDYLDGRHIYACVHCHTHFVDAENLISKVKIKYNCNSMFRIFMERLAKLIYFRTCNYTLNPWNDSVNVYLGPEAEKIMMTGLHRVSDIFCKMCFKLAGWTYVRKKSHIPIDLCLWAVREVQGWQVYHWKGECHKNIIQYSSKLDLKQEKSS